MEQVFKPSINIKYDFKANDLLEYYIPTPTHIDVINAVCESVIYSKASNNQIIIGAYGTGKSLLGLLITSFLSKAFSEEDKKELTKAFSKYDEKIASNLAKLEKSPLQFIPVFISGNEGEFQSAILLNTINALVMTNVHLELNDKSSEILKILNKWEIEYPGTFKQFKKLLKQEECTYHDYKKLLENFDDWAYHFFETVYPTLTAGSTFNYFSYGNFLTQLESIFSQLEALGYGIIYVYDEFGRFLQTLPYDKTYATMEIIQDFAELVDHGVSNVRSVLISHKDMRQYFLDKPQFIDEFARIEKRFKKHYITSNKDIFFNFAEKIISNIRKGDAAPFYLESQLNKLRNYQLFPLNRTELEKIVVTGCYPLHPVALSLLQPLSNAFGQNERTLFSFLDTDDTYGLKSHLRNSGGVYYPHQLFDFFFPNPNDLSYLDSKYGHLKTYIKNYNKIPRNKEPEKYEKMLGIMKFITLWQITGLHTMQGLTNEFISYAMDYSLADTQKALDKLRSFRALRFNRLLDQWEIYEGSSVDLDMEIQKKVSSLLLTPSQQANLIQSLLDKKFFTADPYNLQKKMVRFAEVRVYTTEFLLEQKDFSFDSSADAIINLIIHEQGAKEDISKKIESVRKANKKNIFCLTYKPITEFEKHITRYESILALLTDNRLLAEDQFVEFELRIELEETLYQLKNKIKTLTEFNDEFVWLFPETTESLKVKNDMMLKRLLSERFYNQYPSTPIINNEAFNRRHVAAVQKTSAKKVIDAMLHCPEKENFDIAGFGPDYLIFATVFKNNGVLTASDLLNISDSSLAPLHSHLKDTLETSNRFSDLVELLRNEPYGIREPVIPVLLMGLLLNAWPNLMFFNKGQFISKITSEEFYQMIDQGGNITYQINRFDESDMGFFEEMVSLFKAGLSEHVLDKPINIQASSALLGWLQGLPRYTQTSNLQADELLEFKRYIRRLEVDPSESLAWLKEHSTDIPNFKKELESWYHSKVGEAFSEISQTLNIPNLYDWAQEKSETIKDNRFLTKILRCSNKDAVAFISDLSKQLFEYRATEWTDALAETFKREIYSRIESVNAIKFNPEKHFELKINNKTKYIKKTELTPRAKSLHDNLQRMINSSGKRITNSELEYILYTLVQEKLAKNPTA